MSKNPPAYTRLTRPVGSVASYHSLWLATDHLLVVTATGYRENYQRLQFRDIKGFFTIPSNRRGYWNLAWAIIAAPSAIAMVVALGKSDYPFFSGAIFIGALIALVWN